MGSRNTQDSNDIFGKVVCDYVISYCFYLMGLYDTEVFFILIERDPSLLRMNLDYLGNRTLSQPVNLLCGYCFSKRSTKSKEICVLVSNLFFVTNLFQLDGSVKVWRRYRERHERFAFFFCHGATHTELIPQIRLKIWNYLQG